jgi:hypothetical protein
MLSHSIITTTPRPTTWVHASLASEFTSQEQLDKYLTNTVEPGAWVIYNSLWAGAINTSSLYYVIDVCTDLSKLTYDYLNRPKTHLLGSMHETYVRGPEWEHIDHFRPLAAEVLSTMHIDTNDFIQNRLKTFPRADKGI